MLFVLTLEPLAERYTEQWYRWFQYDFDELGVAYEYVDGEKLTDKVEVGAVLDANGTNYWKASQIMKVCRLFKEGMVKDGDKFFTMDLWHPALEMIPYMSHLNGVHVDIYGFLHAGSYTTEDFAQPMAEWATYFEQGWAKICTGIFVGTDYHKQKFIRSRGMFQGLDWQKKIHVTGNPFNSEEFYELCHPKSQEERGKTIIYPHRFDIEKRPDVFMDIIEELWKYRQDFKVIFTTSREVFRSNRPELIERLNSVKFNYEIRANLTKEEYYQSLASSRVFVSTTIEENFGYCLLEALAAGCIPVVVDGFSHPEILEGTGKKFLCNSKSDFITQISKYLDGPVDPPMTNVFKYNEAITRMVKVMYD